MRPFKKKNNMVLNFHKWIPHQKITDSYFFSSELSPFEQLCPFLRVRMKFFNQDISKTIAARSFKLGQLIEDMVKIFKKLFFL